MDIEQFRNAGYAVVDQICEYYKNLEQRPVWAPVKPGFLGKSIPDSAPEEGEAWTVIFRDWEKVIMPGITHWQHPNFYAYFPSNATKEGILADMLAASISNPGFNWSCSPSVTELEILMMDWVAKMLGLSDHFLSTGPSGKGGGVILGSASEVALTIAIAARERAISHLAKSSPSPQEAQPEHVEPSAEPEVEDFNVEPGAPSGPNEERKRAASLARWRGNLTSRLVMYGTTQTHSIGMKAALILGLDFRALDVQKEDNFALRGATLRRALKEDIASGRLPFMLIATLGTTSSGAIDNITEIMQVALDYPSLWVHVDAAYAGVALALPHLRERAHLDAINSPCDSFSTNYHKWGLTQFDCSPLLVRDHSELTRALTVTPEFLRTKEGDAGSVVDLRNMQISLGRRFRSLKLWFVLRSFGLNGFRQHISTTMALAQHFASLVGQHGDLLEVVAPPQWSLVVFRARRAELSDQELDTLNRKFWDALSSRATEFALTQTVLPEIGFCIRMAVGSPQTEQRHVDATFALIKQCAEQVLSP
ncbi:PLP-dependent transferase [Tilletiaria anomala UBC 951]|uniref:PLP-dependent transferase n=1 Tax=Tilletiaria anomala (strain ATCC 24038 / CBS 436.72 / UBC 951) TaxID=1037660 RepID=A0A066VUY5_TILAU|nr:PLP-dependent transferase [Tilletiaria anomala UBC 951]KDN44103.1 PLP-dependent transferase [Tilletiaria anomala UBC 951]